MAEKVKELFKSRGYKFFIDSPTNQQFIILSNEKQEMLSEMVNFEFWERIDENNVVVRFATSWSTTENDIAELEKVLDTVDE